MEKLKCPRIRFKGFDRNWTEKTFRDFSSVQMCRRIFKSETKTKDEVPFFKIGTFGSIPDAFISRELYQEYIDKYPYPEIGDVLISASGTIGRTVIYNGETAYYQDSNIIWLKLDKLKVSNNFLLPFYALAKWNNIEGSTIKRLYNSDLLATKINYPSLTEQDQIGHFFQNLDQSIALHEKKLAQTQNLKKAMLEKMFPKAGSTQPEIRLKGFIGDWEQVELDTVFSFLRGEAFSKSDISDKGNFRSIHYGELFTRYGAVIEEISSKTNLKAENLGKKGDVLMPSSDVTPDGLAKASSLQVDDVYLGGDINILRPKKECCSNFFSYLINHQKFKILLCVTGTTVKHVYNKDLKSLAYMIPKLDEQIKIGRLFKQFDESLVLQQQQLQTLKNLKQVFLEKMFV